MRSGRLEGLVIKPEYFEKWIYVRIPADARLGELLGSISEAKIPAAVSMLIDASQLQGFDNPTSHALLGQHMAERFAGARKVAVWVPESIISYDGERTAQINRLNLRVFTSRAEAEQWLLA